MSAHASIVRPPVRLMQADDIEAGLRLCRASGWNQVARDWDLFLRLSPGGCYVATGEAGEVIGSVATLRYQEHFSWIAMVLVDPAHRRRGVGRALLMLALEALNGERSRRLDATPAGFGLYGQLGFREEARLHRWERQAAPVPRLAARPRARRMGAADAPALVATDRQVFGADRSVLLTSLLAAAPAYAWIVDGPGGRPRGYLLGRPGFAFDQLGPLVADSAETAGAMVACCLDGSPGRPFIIDVPEAATRLHAFLASLGFARQRPFIRMYCGAWTWPPTSDGLFAILGPEFG